MIHEKRFNIDKYLFDAILQNIPGILHNTFQTRKQFLSIRYLAPLFSSPANFNSANVSHPVLVSGLHHASTTCDARDFLGDKSSWRATPSRQFFLSRRWYTTRRRMESPRKLARAYAHPKVGSGERTSCKSVRRGGEERKRRRGEGGRSEDGGCAPSEHKFPEQIPE